MKFQSVTEIEVKLSFGDTDLSVGRLASRQNKYFFQFDMIFFTAGTKILHSDHDFEGMLKCLAFDAITGWRVFDLHWTAKYEPNLRVAEVIEANEFEILEVLLFHIGRRPIRPPPEMTVLE